jgi:hypothetical protein
MLLESVILSEVEESRRSPTHPYRPNLSPKEVRRSPFPALPPSVPLRATSVSSVFILVLNPVKRVAENKLHNTMISNHLYQKQIWHTYPSHLLYWY